MNFFLQRRSLNVRGHVEYQQLYVSSEAIVASTKMYAGVGPILLPSFLMSGGFFLMKGWPLKVPCAANDWDWRHVFGFSNQDRKS